MEVALRARQVLLTMIATAVWYWVSVMCKSVCSPPRRALAIFDRSRMLKTKSRNRAEIRCRSTLRTTRNNQTLSTTLSAVFKLTPLLKLVGLIWRQPFEANLANPVHLCIDDLELIRAQSFLWHVGWCRSDLRSIHGDSHGEQLCDYRQGWQKVWDETYRIAKHPLYRRMSASLGQDDDPGSPHTALPSSSLHLASTWSTGTLHHFVRVAAKETGRI